MNGNRGSIVLGDIIPSPRPYMKSGMFGRGTRGASTGKQPVHIGGDVFVLVERGSGVGPVWLHSSRKFIALFGCCSSCVTVCEKLSRMINWVLYLIKLVC